MDPIKEAFEKIKQDIFSLKTEIQQLRNQLFALQEKSLSSLSFEPNNPTHTPTQDYPPVSTPTHTPTHPTPLESLYPQLNALSIGNKGVPTDNPTDRQTIQQTDKSSAFSHQNTPKASKDEFEKAREILDSLDTLKREIRLKFKRLTPQEMQVFSVLYSLEEQNLEEISYKIIAQRLSLTESSIRDYITKIISKGIPILKIRQNNKKISLKISPDLQKVASLSTITKLREI